MHYFKKVYIEITNICNLACSFCPKTNRSPLFMEEKLFTKILQELKGHTKHLNFHVLGEPLLHPDLGEFLTLSHLEGYQVNITTNGTLLNSVNPHVILKEGLRQLNISLHSYEGNSQLEELDDYLQQVMAFIQVASEKKPDLFINLRLWNLKDSISSKATNQYVLNMLEDLLQLDGELSLQPLLAGKSITLRKNLFLSSDVEFLWPSLAREPLGDKGYCYGLKSQIAILVDGTVIPCCLDGEGVIDLGNIKDTPFLKIINGTRAQNMFQGFSCRKIVEPLCQRCDFRTRFN